MAYLRAQALARAGLSGVRAAAATVRSSTHTHAALAVACATRVAPFAVRATGVRWMGVPAKAQATGLSSVLASELEYERSEGDVTSTLNEISTALKEKGWALVDTPGLARFSLTKTLGGTTVRLDLDCSPMPADEEEEEAEEAPDNNEDGEGAVEGYRMLVSVSKAGKPAVVQVGAFITDHLRVHRVTLFKDGKAPSADQVFGGVDETPVYGGPAFDELDTQLQNGFYEHLTSLGVDDELATSLADYCSAKEQQEYERWLAGMKDFTA